MRCLVTISTVSDDNVENRGSLKFIFYNTQNSFEHVLILSAELIKSTCASMEEALVVYPFTQKRHLMQCLHAFLPLFQWSPRYTGVVFPEGVDVIASTSYGLKNDATPGQLAIQDVSSQEINAKVDKSTTCLYTGTLRYNTSNTLLTVQLHYEKTKIKVGVSSTSTVPTHTIEKQDYILTLMIYDPVWSVNDTALIYGHNDLKEVGFSRTLFLFKIH